MSNIARLLAMVVYLSIVSAIISISSVASASEQASVSGTLKQQLLGAPVYIQIFKEEKTLELYAQLQGEYRLLASYPICNFSGGLGPKRREGDFKSPEGFYSITTNNLKPDSKFYRAINVGYPNSYDLSKGYSGNSLMIHGNCVSVGCYAMTDAYMDEIFHYVRTAMTNGQTRVNINIYPFRMTDENMQRHRTSFHYDFWRQLQPGYQYFVKHRQPPAVTVSNGQYVMMNNPSATPKASEYAFTQVK